MYIVTLFLVVNSLVLTDYSQNPSPSLPNKDEASGEDQVKIRYDPDNNRTWISSGDIFLFMESSEGSFNVEAHSFITFEGGKWVKPIDVNLGISTRLRGVSENAQTITIRVNNAPIYTGNLLCVRFGGLGRRYESCTVVLRYEQFSQLAGAEEVVVELGEKRAALTIDQIAVLKNLLNYIERRNRS